MFQLQRFFLLHCDEWDRVVALPRHKFVTGATLLQLEYPERTTDHEQATGKLYHLRLRVECTLFINLQSRARTHAVLVIGMYELFDPTT